MNAVTKFLLVAAAAAAGAMTGLFFAKRFKWRAEYYKALLSLLNHILTEVKFRREPVKTILRAFLNAGETPLSKNLSEYIEAPDPKSAKLSKGWLSAAELGEVQKFLTAFGTLDSETQSYELEAEKERFASLAAAARERRERLSSMSVKLGFFAGLAFGILIL